MMLTVSHCACDPVQVCKYAHSWFADIWRIPLIWLQHLWNCFFLAKSSSYDYISGEMFLLHMTLVCEFSTGAPYTSALAFPCFNPFFWPPLLPFFIPCCCLHHTLPSPSFLFLHISPFSLILPHLSFLFFPIPHFLWHACRLYCPPRSCTPLVLELLINVAVNAATFYLFLAHSFKLPNSGQWQRVMWWHATPVLACRSITSSRWYAYNQLNVSNLFYSCTCTSLISDNGNASTYIHNANVYK